jgi:hypothetical protein
MGKTRAGRVQSQLAFALALMLALVGIAGAVRANAQATPISAAGISVGCDPASIDGTTTCTISASDADQLIVPYGALCGTVVSSTGVAGAEGYESSAGSPSVSFVLSTPVTAGGGATYTVLSSGVAAAVGGLAVVCDDTVAASETSTEAEGDFGSAVDEPAESAEDTSPASGVSGTPEATDVVDEEIPTDDAATPGATEPAGDGIEPANVVVDPSTTPEASPTLGAAATITVLSYLCATDPGTSDPASAGCTLANAVPYTATDASGTQGPTSTDASGVATFTSNIGSSLTVKQGTSATLSGYVPRGDGTLEVQSLTGDVTLIFVNIIKAEQGRLQIVGGLCPSTSASHTEWTLVDPQGVSTAAVPSCQPNAGAVFTVSSPALPGGSMAVRVESNGTWKGYVPSGSYVITAPDGTPSDSLSVYDNYTSVAVAMTYEQQELGTLSLEHFLCTDGENGEFLSVDPGDAPDASCSSAGTTLYVSDTSSGADPSAVTIAPNGTSSFNFKPGEYEVTSDDGTASVIVNVVAGQTVTVRSITIASTGALMLTAMQCPAGYTPASIDAVVSDCTGSWGSQTFALTPGNSVTTSGAGSAVVSNLLPGTYRLAGSGVCAVVEDGADVSGGFEINAGLTTSIVVYGCPPDDGTGGNGGGPKPTPGDGTGNPDNGGNGSGDDGTGIGGNTNQPFASNSVLNVSQLPNTGGGKSTELPWLVLVLLAGAFVAGTAGIGLRRSGR